MYSSSIEKIIFWIEKAKEVAENEKQKKALTIVLKKRKDPFSGFGNNTSVHISDFPIGQSRNGYKNGYFEYKYNKGYQKGVKYNHTPRTNTLTLNTPPSNTSYMKMKHQGIQNAKLNAKRNGYKGK